MGPLQDANARRYNAPQDASTERDLRGGWYDAGDCNKYTSWTAGYVIGLLHAYAENPAVWTDDFNIPESGNGVPDLLDEVKWGVDHLVRMQNGDGSVLSIVGLSCASPPSSATGPESLWRREHVCDLVHRGRICAGGTHLRIARHAGFQCIRRRPARACRECLGLGGRESERDLPQQ